MMIIAIDGACRRNGKPDCTSAGAAFIQVINDDKTQFAQALSVHEYNSTSQRGELLALLVALDSIYSAKQEAQIVTDSEYLFNAMTRQWYNNWSNNGWLTASGETVKNKDIWLEIMHAINRITTEVYFYHIKGHCIPFGRVTADKLLQLDTSGMLLYTEVCARYDAVAYTKAKIFSEAQALSERNNGFELTKEVFKRFVTINTVADAVATKMVDTFDRKR